MNTFKQFCTLFLTIILAGCSIQRAQNAETAKMQMVGMSKETIFACMGPPAQKSTEGQTEIWTYNSGDGRVDSIGTASTFGTGSATSNGHSANVNASAVGVRSSSQQMRFCIINIVMNHNKVQTVNYNGPSGGVFTKGEQCAYAVENCINKNPTAIPNPQ